MGGVGEARPEGPRAEDGVLGEETASASPPNRVLWGAVSSLSGVRGGAPTAEGFSCISEPSDCLSQHLSTCCIQLAWLGIRFF